MKAIVSADGLMAQAVNPYIIGNPPICFDSIEERKLLYKQQLYFDNFEAASPPRPLITPQEPGVTIEVKEVWQYKFNYEEEWLSENENAYKKYNDFKAYCDFNSSDDVVFRIALEPIKKSDAEEPTHPLDGCNPDKDNCTPHEEYVDAIIVNRKKSGLYEDDCVTLKNPSQIEWNLAIEEAVKMLEDLAKVQTEAQLRYLITQLNHLRK